VRSTFAAPDKLPWSSAARNERAKFQSKLARDPVAMVFRLAIQKCIIDIEIYAIVY
jgi:hypothetical protein